MVNLILPEHLDPLQDYLRELYSWDLFIDNMEQWSLIIFNQAEFIKPIDEMDEEKALLQWCACLENMYKFEKAIEGWTTKYK